MAASTVQSCSRTAVWISRRDDVWSSAVSTSPRSPSTTPTTVYSTRPHATTLVVIVELYCPRRWTGRTRSSCVTTRPVVTICCEWRVWPTISRLTSSTGPPTTDNCWARSSTDSRESFITTSCLLKDLTSPPSPSGTQPPSPFRVSFVHAYRAREINLNEMKWRPERAVIISFLSLSTHL